MHNFINFTLPDYFVSTPKNYEEKIGLFFENFNFFYFFEKKILKLEIFNENFLYSKRKILIGSYFQKKPFSQSQILNVIKSKKLDMILDFRVACSSISKWMSYLLSNEAIYIIYVLVGSVYCCFPLEEKYLVSYKIDNKSSRVNKIGIIFNDGGLNINWSNVN